MTSRGGSQHGIATEVHPVERIIKPDVRNVWIGIDGSIAGYEEKPQSYVPCLSSINERGERRFLAIGDDVRESIQRWREVSVNLKIEGMNVPKLGIGDGVMGFWPGKDCKCPFEKVHL